MARGSAALRSSSWSRPPRATTVREPQDRGGAVVVPRRLVVVVPHAVRRQAGEVQPDEVALGRGAGVAGQALGDEVRQVAHAPGPPCQLPVAQPDAAGVVEEDVVEPEVAVAEGDRWRERAAAISGSASASPSPTDTAAGASSSPKTVRMPGQQARTAAASCTDRSWSTRRSSQGARSRPASSQWRAWCSARAVTNCSARAIGQPASWSIVVAAGHVLEDEDEVVRVLVDEGVVAVDGQQGRGAQVPVEAHLAGIHVECFGQRPALVARRGELGHDAGGTVTALPGQRVAAQLPQQPDADADRTDVHVHDPGRRADRGTEHRGQPRGIHVVGRAGQARARST